MENTRSCHLSRSAQSGNPKIYILLRLSRLENGWLPALQLVRSDIAVWHPSHVGMLKELWLKSQACPGATPYPQTFGTSIRLISTTHTSTYRTFRKASERILRQVRDMTASHFA